MATSHARIGPKIDLGAHAALVELFTNANAGATFACEVMPRLISRTLQQELKGVFSGRELRWLIEACARIGDGPTHAGNLIVLALAEAHPSAEDETAWAALREKVHGLTVFQRVSLEVWGRYCQRKHHETVTKSVIDLASDGASR